MVNMVLIFENIKISIVEMKIIEDSCIRKDRWHYFSNQKNI